MLRVDAKQINQVLHPRMTLQLDIVATGLPASPEAASGSVVLMLIGRKVVRKKAKRLLMLETTLMIFTVW